MLIIVEMTIKHEAVETISAKACNMIDGSGNRYPTLNERKNRLIPKCMKRPEEDL